MNVKLPSLSVNYGSVYLVLLHLKAGDGDLVAITEPALLRDAHDNRMRLIAQPYYLSSYVL